MPDYDGIEDEQMKFVKKKGVSAEACEMLFEPTKKIRFNKIPGVSGELPTPRKRCQYEVLKEVLYIYGGVNQDGDTFEELYSVSLPALEFRCLHKSELVSKLTAAEKRLCTGREPGPRRHHDEHAALRLLLVRPHAAGRARLLRRGLRDNGSGGGV